MSKGILIKNASELVTCSGYKGKKGKEMNELFIINHGAVVIEDGLIKAVGTTKDILSLYNEADYQVIDADGKAVLPGFVDSHTHFVFGGYRAEEFSWRLRGDKYMDIMNRGGGIASSVNATRDASFEELYSAGIKRLNSMVSFGVTTVEGKSGYGLDLDTELKQLQVMKELNSVHPLDIVTTYLGAHATPKEYKGNTDGYVDYMIRDVLPKVKPFAEFCDVFCEENVFSIEQSRKLLLKAKEMGFNLKLHADEIVQLGGAELAGELGAVSADHLLQASDNGIKAMTENNVTATLLPATAFSLNESFAKGREIIDSGCAVALATDFNPGSCFTESIPLVFALACIKMKLTVEEAITALTINGAAALNIADKTGSIDIGKNGDIIILEFPSYKFIPYHIGVSTVEKVIKKGKLIYDKEKGGLL